MIHLLARLVAVCYCWLEVGDIDVEPFHSEAEIALHECDVPVFQYNTVSDQDCQG